MGELICVGVIGSAVIAVCVIERRLEAKGMYLQSDTLRSVITSLLTIGGIAAVSYFLFKMIGRFILHV